MHRLALLSFAAMSSMLVAQATVSETLQNGKTSLDTRTRYENDDDAAFTAPADHKTANALTNQTRLGYTTGPFHGIKAKLEFLNVSALGEERFNSTLDGRAQFAVVQNPGLTQVNQAYLEFKGLKVGRQALSVDNQRFIGPGAWNQTPKGFTGAVFQNSTWVPATDLMVGHLIRIHTSLGINRDLKADFARFRYTP